MKKLARRFAESSLDKPNKTTTISWRKATHKHIPIAPVVVRTRKSSSVFGYASKVLIFCRMSGIASSVTGPSCQLPGTILE